ncbi:adenine phosphoribosyltransferase [Escherichia coli]|uniref:adenine phosphoribosyltransferase n=1 Tax=Escherichia coli TaxID=562 RepID=A0A2X1NH01_ECOLX|nr:adenine phosphoribosyltransferase [Escherichia coli]
MTATAQQLEYLKIASKAFRTTQNPAFFSAMSPAYWKTRKLTLSASTCWLSVTKMRALPKLSAPKRVLLVWRSGSSGLGVGFVPVRKPGKLPRETISETYDLEYGTDQLEIHVDAIKPGDKVLVVDDLLATGGTIEATVKLIRRLGGEVADAAFIINLFDLGGEQRLEKQGITSYSLVPFPGH